MTLKELKGLYEQQKEFWAGVIMVALLVFVLSLSYNHKLHQVPSNGMVLHATYSKADGINVGSDVRLAGVKVGYVGTSKLDDFYRVQMSFVLSEKVDLPLDSAAIIETDGLVGGKYIELLPGGDEEMMQSGDHFLYTQDVLLLNELLERFIDWMRDKKGVSETQDD
ncbi:MAG: MCE family protein [Alphaproteobacteria bacterium]|nr:MCE family protein [Alphaproteobacteria bacterium]